MRRQVTIASAVSVALFALAAPSAAQEERTCAGYVSWVPWVSRGWEHDVRATASSGNGDSRQALWLIEPFAGDAAESPHETVYQQGFQGRGLWSGGTPMTENGVEEEWLDFDFGTAIVVREVRLFRSCADEYQERFPRRILVMSGGEFGNSTSAWAAIGPEQVLSSADDIPGRPPGCAGHSPDDDHYAIEFPEPTTAQVFRVRLRGNFRGALFPNGNSGSMELEAIDFIYRRNVADVDCSVTSQRLVPGAAFVVVNDSATCCENITVDATEPLSTQDTYIYVGATIGIVLVVMATVFAVLMSFGVRLCACKRDAMAKQIVQQTKAADSIAVETAARYRAIPMCCCFTRYVRCNGTLLEHHLEQTTSGCGPWTKFDAQAAIASLKRAQARAFRFATGCNLERVEYYLWGGLQYLERTPNRHNGRVWTENISQCTAEAMEAMHVKLAEDLDLKSDETLVFHFTTDECTDLIFGADSPGMRASAGGVGGAGVYVCTTPLHTLGWEQYGGNGWREQVGRALWNENWANVLIGGRDEDKLEVVLVLRVKKSMLWRYTDERPHAAVIKRKLLMESGGHHWFPKSQIVRVWGLTSAGGDLAAATKRFWCDIRRGRPGVSTSMKEGQQLWIENISRSSPDEMRAMLEALAEDEELREDQMLVFHFTTETSARAIFSEGSIGIRASAGAGVHVCPTPLHTLGWEQYGGDTWRQKLGRAIWPPENWKDVLLDGCDADKVTVVLAMKCCSSMVSLNVQKRPHAAVVKRRLLVKAGGGDAWFPSTEIVKVWGLANDFEGVGWSEAEARAAFAKADTDTSNELDREEVKALLAERGLCCSDGYIDGVFGTYDADKSGTIDFEEFAQLSRLVARRLANGAGFDTLPPSVVPLQTSPTFTRGKAKAATRRRAPPLSAATTEATTEHAKTAPPSLDELLVLRRAAAKPATQSRLPAPALPTFRSPVDGTSRASATTTINPLAKPPVRSSRSETLDVKAPPPLHTLQRRSGRSKAEMRAASWGVDLMTLGADARSAETGQALPSRRPTVH